MTRDYALAGLHRHYLVRLHDHEPLLHPILPSCSQLLDGMHVLLPAQFLPIHPIRRAGSRHDRLVLHGRHP